MYVFGHVKTFLLSEISLFVSFYILLYPYVSLYEEIAILKFNIVLRLEMTTLPNVNSRQGGNEPSHVGLTSNVSPEVQCLEAENSHTGDTSDFVHRDNHHWFVFRALYGHANDAVDKLKERKVTVYVPMCYGRSELSGKKKIERMPLLPGLVFAYMTREMTYEFVKKPASTAKYLKYYTDRTRPIEPETGYNPPITIPEDKMRAFMNVVDTKNEHIIATSKERCRFKSGDMFQVVCGEFKGVVGQVVRAAGQQRIAVELNGIGYVLTAYIPSDFLMKIDDKNKIHII